MDKRFICVLFVCITWLALIECARKECVQRQIPNADTVCVCNATYCDNFPALQKPKTGFAFVYESSKSGNRFKETELKIESSNKTSTASKHQTVTISSTVKQSINGFGGAFTDTTGQMLKLVPESLANAVIESYFSADGIEYSMARVPIAATDYSVRSYTYDDVEGDLNLTHFALEKEDLEWKIPYIKMAQKLSPHKIKLFGSPWNFPQWMLTAYKENKTACNRLIKGEVGGEYYQSLANYFVKFLDSYKSHDINFWGITVKNEPVYGQNPGMGIYCLNLTFDVEKVFVRSNLGPALEKAGYSRDKLKLMIFDDNVPELQKWTDTILADKEAAKYVSGIAFHWYSNSRMGGYPDKLLEVIHQTHPNFFTLNTEACHLEGAGNGRWDFGEHYAYDIIRALNGWSTGWVEWNMVLDTIGRHDYNCKSCTTGFGGPIYVEPKVGEAYKQPTYYAIGHFSKFIVPDSVVIEHKIDQQLNGLSVLTVRRPDNATVVIALNANDTEIELNINDSKNYLTHTIPARSIQSYIWW